MATKFIGPWTGGLNMVANRDLSPFLNSNELGEATNVIYTPHGFLEPRPGCRVFTDDTWNSNLYAYMDDADNSAFRLIGWVDAGDDGIFAYITVLENGIEHLYKISDSGDSFEMYSTNTPVGFTHLINHHGFVADVNLDTNPDHTGMDYFYPKDTGIIFFTNTFNTAYIAADTADLSTLRRLDQKLMIPASDMGMVVKDRLFLFDKKASKMYYSPPGYILDFRVFNELNPPTEPISIAAPFGEDTSGEEPIEPSTDVDDIIRCVEFQNNNFYIFKRNSTFLFTYQNSPITDGYMRKISDRMGAFDSTIYKENIIIVNNKGVYRVDGTDFLDLQEKMNFRFEIPLDHTGVKPDNIFITNFNDTILFGMLDIVSDPVNQPAYYYAMNGNTGAWSKWDYDYTSNIAKPGSDYILCCPPNSVKMKMLYTTFDKKRIVFMDWKPSYDNFDYHLDSNTSHTDILDELYFPNVNIKTTASFGDSMLKYKKLYRYYIRFYLSDNPVPFPEYPVWTLSLNYNQYQFDAKHNPKFYLYPSVQKNFPGTKTEFGADSIGIEAAVYKRTYQVALPQQRVTEFLFELSRRYTTLPVGLSLKNLEANRSINTGYYFLLSGFWFDYDNKAGI